MKEWASTLYIQYVHTKYERTVPTKVSPPPDIPGRRTMERISTSVAQAPNFMIPSDYRSINNTDSLDGCENERHYVGGPGD